MSNDTFEAIHSRESDDGGNGDSESDSDDDGTLDYECNVCGSKFESRESRNKHFKKHHF